MGGCRGSDRQRADAEQVSVEVDPLGRVWWQAWGDGLYRREGARRALIEAYEQAELRRQHEAALAEQAARDAALEARREQGRRRMAESDVAAAGGRDRWVYLQRLAGRKFKDIAADIGTSTPRSAQIFKRQAKLEKQLQRERELREVERLAEWVRTVWLKFPLNDEAYLGRSA